MSVTEADSHYRRAQRDLRYLTTAFKTYTDQRAKLRTDLERRLDRVGGGPKAFLLEEAIRRMDEEDAEEPDAGLLDQYPRSSATTRPSYRIVSRVV